MSIKSIVAICLLSWSFSVLAYAQTKGQKVDLSTKEAVIEQLGKQKKADLSNAKICVERLKESSKIIIIGSFRYDYGCHFDGAFVDAVYFEEGDAELSKNALTALGWKKAKSVLREKLAKLWVEKGLLAFSTVLYSKDEDFVVPRVTYKGGRQPKPREFQPPQVITKENGETIVSLWTSVMRRKKEFRGYEFRFSPTGKLLED